MDIINIKQLLQLAEDFGLACIEERDGVTLTIVGEKQHIVFNKAEGTQCQLIEIY